MAAVVNLLEKALRRIVTDLGSMNAQWAIIGGLAVSARAEPRTTRDVDIAVATVTDSDAERMVHSLQSIGYRVRTVVEHEAAGRLATARLFLSEEPELLVDLLFASSGIEPEIVHRADSLEILPGLIVNVASVGHLLALKILARDDRTRPQDLDDIRALLSHADAPDISDARHALTLIEQRGYARRRPLLAQFDEILVSETKRNPPNGDAST